MRISRETINSVTVPEELSATLRLRPDYAQTAMRPLVIVESLKQRTGKDENYTVTVTGCIQTAAGRDHARNRGQAYFTGSEHGRRISDLPAELAGLLLGPDRLRDAF